MISNVNSLAIVTSSICEPLAIVTSHWSIILALYLWTLSSPQWRCQPGRFSMAAHRHDRRGIYRCVLLRFRGRIEIDHSYGLHCRGLCCHSWHSTRGAGRRGLKRPRNGRPHSCCAGSGSTNHSSTDRIVVNSYNHEWIMYPSNLRNGKQQSVVLVRIPTAWKEVKACVIVYRNIRGALT